MSQLSQQPLQRKKRNFSPQEDEIIVNNVGKLSFSEISTLLNDRTPRQCRERYNNYLRPNLKREKWTPEEDSVLIKGYQKYGAQWSKIAHSLNGRTSNDCKNRWYVHLSKGQSSSEPSQLTIGHTMEPQIIKQTSIILPPPTFSDSFNWVPDFSINFDGEFDFF